MKVKCISLGRNYIRYGEVYDVTSELGVSYGIMNLQKGIYHYPKSEFEIIVEEKEPMNREEHTNMKVRCIIKGECHGLTHNKEYWVIKLTDTGYKITDDAGFKILYPKYMFEVVTKPGIATSTSTKYFEVCFKFAMLTKTQIYPYNTSGAQINKDYEYWVETQKLAMDNGWNFIKSVQTGMIKED